MEFSFKDTYRAMIEYQSNGKNTVIYDDFGNPNIMYVIPKQALSWFDLGGYDCSGTHPAFLFHGREVDEIFVGKYVASYMGTTGGVPVSQFGVSPADCIPYTKMVRDSFKKGRGWHMMQNLEFALFQLQAQTTGIYPYGNINDGHGSDYRMYGKLDTLERSSPHGRRILTGTGPKEFYHDHTFSGVSDLYGNVCCWCGGAKLVRGELWFAGEENQLMNNWDIDDSECGANDMTGYNKSMVVISEDCKLTSSAPLGAPKSKGVIVEVNNGIQVNTANPPSTDAMRSLAVNGMLRHPNEPSRQSWVIDRDGVHHICRGERVGSSSVNLLNHIRLSTGDEGGGVYGGFRVCYMNI